MKWITMQKEDLYILMCWWKQYRELSTYPKVCHNPPVLRSLAASKESSSHTTQEQQKTERMLAMDWCREELSHFTNSHSRACIRNIL